MNICILDTETGGITPDYSLLSLGYLLVDEELKLLDFGYHIFSCPFYLVTTEAMRVNTLDLNFLEKYGETYQEVYDKLFYKFFKNGKITPCGWNPAFDVGFIKEHIFKGGDDKFSYRVLDLHSIVKWKQMENVSFGPDDLSSENIFNHFNVQPDEELTRNAYMKSDIPFDEGDLKIHNAFVDAQLVWEVLKRLKNGNSGQ